MTSLSAVGQPGARSRTPIGTLLTELAEQKPDAPAVTFEGRTLTRAELDSAANRLARGYQALGVAEGDMVTIALPNGPEFILACCATWKLGAIPQPVSSRLPLAERQAIVELADSQLIVGVEAGLHGDRPTLPIGFAPDPGLDDSPLPPVVSPSWKAPTSGGSTGRPKLIVAGQPGLMDNLVALFFGLEEGYAQLVAGPLYHNGPFLFAMIGLLAGQHIVVLPRFEAEAALDAIERYEVDVLMVVPTMMNRMLRVVEQRRDVEEQPCQLGSIRRLWHMAAPCPDWLKRAWIDLLGPERIFELYGGTEGQATTVIDGRDWMSHPGSVGRAATGEIAILDEQGETLPPGQIGEIYLRSGASAKPTYRYVGAEPRRHGSWESIGDLGWMDEDGFLYIADRRTDLILSGGANIYPAEVEGALLEHPAVGSCAVVGVPDDDLGQVVHAVVHAVEPVAVEELAAFLAERLVRYKVPRTWELVDEPVRDDAGKVRRSALAARSPGSPPAAR